MLILIPFLISLVFLMRTVLIMVGLLKGPVLQTFEKYGDDEIIYHPLPSLLFWTGVLVITLSPVLAASLRISLFPVIAPGFLMLIAAYFITMHPEFVRQHPDIFMVYPRWYHQLRARTSRYERRRIAYKWLWLPPRLRLAYNGNDHAFNQWADLIIMSTTDIDETAAEIRDNPSERY
jgi:hypothetical protein